MNSTNVPQRRPQPHNTPTSHARNNSLISPHPMHSLNLMADLENQKTECKSKKQKRLVIQTNFETESKSKQFTPKTDLFSKSQLGKRLFYPLSCKNAKFAAKDRSRDFFGSMLAHPSTAKNSPAIEIEKQARLAFSSKNAKIENSTHFFVSNKREVLNQKPVAQKPKPSEAQYSRRGLHRPCLSLRGKPLQKENRLLKQNGAVKVSKPETVAPKPTRAKALSFKSKPVNFFNVQNLSVKALCYFMDTTENMMNYTLTLQIGTSDNTYFENYIELIKRKDLRCTEQVFDSETGKVVMSSLKHECLLTLVVHFLGQQFLDEAEDITEMLKICVGNRFTILDLLKCEPDIKTPSKTIIEEFVNGMGWDLGSLDRESAVEKLKTNTAQLVCYLEFIRDSVSVLASGMIAFLHKKLSEVDVVSFVELCADILHNAADKVVDKNIYQQRKARRPNFVIQPHRASSLLPPKALPYEYTLVLDLDETLIHCKRTEAKGKILLRPHVKEFLNEMAKFYEIVIFTAADKQYADWVLDRLDVNNTVAHRLYRCSTSNANGFMFKDLSKLGRDLAKMLIVDNKPENFAFQPENGIEILSWYDDPSDNALVELTGVLSAVGGRAGLDLRVAMKECVSRGERNIIYE